MKKSEKSCSFILCAYDSDHSHSYNFCCRD